MTQQLRDFFLNINNDVGFLQLFLQTLMLPAQLLVLGGQRIPLRLRTPLLRKGVVNRAIALLLAELGGNTELDRRPIAPELVVRASTAAPPGGR